ncbi:MAG: Ku protein, partial [Burkholderiales bacterium]
MPHAIWKGAISFGLVHVPVALYPASTEIGIDFDWLDKRSMDPVGYKRVNKKTGKEIAKDHIVKGVKVDGDRYVVLGEEEIKAAYPKTTQTIEIESFVHASEIPFTQLEKPYYLEPIAKGEKVYALLREAMVEAGVIGIARVVLHTKEYLAALIPAGPGLVMNTLRWAEEIRPWTEMKLPPAGKGNLKAAELTMARQLIQSMVAKWKPNAYADKFTHAIHALVAKRVDAGDTETVVPMEEAVTGDGSNVVDLTALLKQSLGKRGGSHQPTKAAPSRAPSARKSAVPKKPARKRA